MSVKNGNQFVNFYVNNNKWVKEIRLGNKILQPWSALFGDSNIQPYVDSYLWTPTSDSAINSDSLRNTGYIKFRVPCTELNLKNIKIVDTIAGSQIARVLIYIKDVNGNEIMHAEMRAERESGSQFYFIVEYYDKNGTQLTGGGYVENFSSNVIPNWQVFKMDKNSSSITSQVWSSGQEYYQTWSLGEVYNGWHYEIEEVSSEPFIWHFNFGKVVGNLPGSELYQIQYQRGIADSSTGLPSNATLDRNEEYTMPNNVMEKADSVYSTYTITFKYNYTGSPADIVDYQYNKRKYTRNGWTKNASSVVRNYSDGEVVCNLLSNTYGETNPVPSLTLYPCFNQSTYIEKVTTPIPTRSGYRFLYWGINSGGTGAQIPGGQEWTFTANTTLFAQWEVE